MKTKTWEKRDLIALVLIPLQLLAQVLIAGNEGIRATLIFVLALGSMLVLLRLYRDVLSRDWSAFRKKLWLKILISIVGALVIVGILSVVRMVITPFMPVADSAAPPDAAELPIALSILFGFVPLFVVFQEEIVLRHVLFFKHIDKRALSIVLFFISAVLFGLIHINSFDGAVLPTVPYMVVGAFFNLVYLFTKNIWYVIGIHFVFNFAAAALPSIAIPIMVLITG